MTKITLLGIDIAKNIFQLHGVNKEGKVILKKKLRREPRKVDLQGSSGLFSGL